MLSEQVIGYYDPKLNRLVIRDDVIAALDGNRDAEVVILHELVHALQDQQLGLGDAYETERDTDADSALRSLAEGDATLAMIAFGASTTAPALTQSPAFAPLLSGAGSLGAQPMGGQQALAEAPAILRVTLVAPYLEGLRFCGTLVQQLGWAAVDQAHRTPPASMEQVMHPSKYLHGELPDTISLPAWPQLAAQGWEQVEEDTLGELELGVFLARGSTSDMNREAAAGWGGDRLRVYQRDTNTAAVWFTTWDDEREATEAEGAARSALDADTEQTVRRRGRAMLVLRGFSGTSAAPIITAFEAFAASLPAAPPRRPSIVGP